MKELDRIINRAKVGVMSKPDSVFFSTILFSLKFSWDEAIPTACTNGKFLKVNPEWFKKLTEPQRVGLLVHEVCHVAYQHMLRISNRDFRIWNMATDHVINLMLLDRGFELPPNGLWDKRFRGMSSEQVYTILEQEFPDGASDQSSGDDSGNGLPDDFQVDMEPAGDGTSDGMKQAEQEITQILVKAATQSKLQGDKPGTIPGEVEIALQKLLNPKLPWRTILQNYLHAMAPEDYSFKRVNRRFLPDVYLPTLYGEGLDSIAVAVDTSGSVTDQQFQAFLSEINDIHQSLRPKKLTVIDFDIRIRDVHELTQDQSVSQIKFTGRGGTNIRQVIDWAAQHKPQVMLIFTDGHFHVYDLDPGIPIIWIIHSNEGFTYGYGKVIEYPL